MSSQGETALCQAVEAVYGAVVDLLLRSGADVNVYSSLGKTALDRAVLGRHETMVRLLPKAECRA